MEVLPESATPDAIRAKRGVFCTRSAQRQVVSCGLFRVGLETNVFTIAKLTLHNNVRRLMNPRAALGTFRAILEHGGLGHFHSRLIIINPSVPMTLRTSDLACTVAKSAWIAVMVLSTTAAPITFHPSTPGSEEVSEEAGVTYVTALFSHNIDERLVS